MIRRVVERETLRRYLRTLHGHLDSSALAGATMRAARAAGEKGDARAWLTASLRNVCELRASSGGEPSKGSFMARDPMVSLFQSELERGLRERGLRDRAPGDRTARAGPLNLLWLVLHPVRYGPTDVEWVTDVAAAMLERLARGNHPFNPVPAVHEISDDARIVVVGDWGSGVARARKVAGVMGEEVAEGLSQGRDVHVIHLGDVYYSGLESEVKRHVLAEGMWPVSFAQARAGVTSWSLNGNHDMYGGGWGYFQTLLADERFAGQRSGDGKPTSFFRLSSPSWDFVGLDTSWDPDLLAMGMAGVLEDPQASFVQEVAGEGDRNLVLLSHHQLLSVYDPGDIGPTLSTKLAPVLRSGGVTAWLWGHEHRCMGFQAAEGVCFPRCVGHGGVPVLMEHRRDAPVPRPGVWEERGYLRSRCERWARFGFAVLDLSPREITMRYRDERGRAVRVERIYPGRPCPAGASSGGSASSASTHGVSGRARADASTPVSASDPRAERAQGDIETDASTQGASGADAGVPNASTTTGATGCDPPGVSRRCGCGADGESCRRGCGTNGCGCSSMGPGCECRAVLCRKMRTRLECVVRRDVSSWRAPVFSCYAYLRSELERVRLPETAPAAGGEAQRGVVAASVELALDEALLAMVPPRQRRECEAEPQQLGGRRPGLWSRRPRPLRRLWGSFWRFYQGSDIEQAWRAVHRAQATLYTLYLEDELVPQAERVEAMLAELPGQAEPMKSVTKLISQMSSQSRPGEPKPVTKPETMLRGIYERATDVSDNLQREARGLRNAMMTASLAIFLVLLTIGIAHAIDPDIVRLCASAEGHACPLGRSKDRLDVLALVLVGALGGLLSAVIPLATGEPIKTPYRVFNQQLILKILAGAASAVGGIILLTGGVITTIKLDTTTAILGYALFFGFAQQVVTGMVDRRANDLAKQTPTTKSV
jgi:hypothetical protein